MSLLPDQYNLDPMILGAVWEPEAFYVTDEGEPKDLADCTIEMEMFDYAGNLIETLTASSGLTIDAAGGIIYPARTVAEVLAKYEEGQYSYKLWITESDGVDKNRWLEGYLEVRK